MLNLDYSLLDELGLGSLPDDEKKLMLADILDNLSEKVGARAGAQLSPQKRAEMDKVMEGNMDGVGVWLEDNLPSYSQIVAEELDKLKAEIKPQVPEILAQFQTAA